MSKPRTKCPYFKAKYPDIVEFIKKMKKLIEKVIIFKSGAMAVYMGRRIESDEDGKDFQRMMDEAEEQHKEGKKTIFIP